LELIKISSTFAKIFLDIKQKMPFIFGKSSDLINFTDREEECQRLERNFMSLINTKERLLEVVSENRELEVSVKIGHDLGAENCALVTAKYLINGEEMGRAGVIGPERMDYNKVIAVLEYIKKMFEKE